MEKRPNRTYDGPAETFPPALTELAHGVWITSGRTAIVETSGALTIIDPGDEAWFEGGSPAGPLAELLSVCDATGLALGRVLITHAHPDHVANLPLLIKYGEGDSRIGSPEVVASARSPLTGFTPVKAAALDDATGLRAVPLKGHSPWGDDLAFYLPGPKILFSGDIAQPKGERWEEAFYPSPWPWFTDGGAYLESLDALLALDFQTLVTGHREVRLTPDGRGWIELTRRAIARVGEEVRVWKGADDPAEAGRSIFLKLAAERDIDPETAAARMTPAGSSVFDRFDMAGILYFWNRR